MGSTLNSGMNFLEIGENAGGEGLAICFVEKRGTEFFAERSVEGEDVVFLFVAGIVADGPVGDDEVGEGVAGAPVVVAAIVDGLVEDEVDDGIGSEARAAHGGSLFGGQTLNDARGDVFRRAHEHGFRATVVSFPSRK